jgi:biopolymer transport protein ExbD
MRIVIGLACALVLAGCDKPKVNSGNNVPGSAAQKPQPPIIPAPAVLAKVRLARDGEIQLDGKKVTLEELKTAMLAFKGKDGAVLFYREKGDSTPEADQVATQMRALARQGVGIKPVQADFTSP